MTSTLLTKADSNYARLRSRREELREEEAHLHEKLRELQGQARSEDQQHDVANKLHAVQEELHGMSGEYEIAKYHAHQVASRQIGESASYRKAVRNAADALAEALPAWLGLEAIIIEAGRGGVALPVSVAAMLAEARTWLKRVTAAGALDVGTLPAPLRVLIGESGV